MCLIGWAAHLLRTSKIISKIKNKADILNFCLNQWFRKEQDTYYALLTWFIKLCECFFYLFVFYVPWFLFSKFFAHKENSKSGHKAGKQVSLARALWAPGLRASMEFFRSNSALCFHISVSWQVCCVTLEWLMKTYPLNRPRNSWFCRLLRVAVAIGINAKYSDT